VISDGNCLITLVGVGGLDVLISWHICWVGELVNVDVGGENLISDKICLINEVGDFLPFCPIFGRMWHGKLTVVQI
jgi:hypothetical protein